MNTTGEGQQIDFTLDEKNLYREESITDLKAGSIRRLIPIHPDGSDDKGRTQLFFGHSQVMSPEGPIPLQGKLNANNLSEALDAFPRVMQKSLGEVVEAIREMQERQKKQQREDSRIIMPR